MPYISQSSIQELTSRLDAAAVVSDYVRLESRGGRLWACCPFHNEKTASFTVNADMKTYYCFGCHKGGTVINFVMEMDKLTFPEAIEVLAKRFAVELVYEDSGGGNFSAEDDAKKKAKEQLYELYRRIEGTFHHFFLKKRENEPEKLYIISRGISSTMIERFRLGYAPADRYWLHKFLVGKGYSAPFLASSGLFSSQYPEVSLFSGRLMFPIADRQGRTVAFGGRFLPGGGGDGTSEGRAPPKYINSPELGIYRKRETLYGLDLALPEIRRTKTVYVAEGYMDVIALHQAGITNAVAPLGTAFTDEQAKLLKRWAEKLIFFFDSDAAGQEAAVKGIFSGRKNGFSCSLVAPESREGEANAPSAAYPADTKDPADILKFFGPKTLQKRAECFITDFEYLLSRARQASTKPASLEGKARAIASVFPYLELLNSEVARESCIEAAADAFGLLPSVVADDYRRYAADLRSVEAGAAGKRPREEVSPGTSEGKTGAPIRMNDELLMLLVVAVDYVSLQKEKIFPEFRKELEISDIDDPNAKELFIALEECIRYEETGLDELLGRISSGDLKRIIVEKSASGEFSSNPGKLVADGIKRIRLKGLERRQDEIIIKLRELKNNGPEVQGLEIHGQDVRELLAEKIRIDEELHLLKQGKRE